MRLVLDAAALLAVERGGRDTVALLKHELRERRGELRALAAGAAVHVDLVVV